MKNVLVVLSCLFLFSCAQDINNDSYTMASVGSANRVGQGVVVDVRTVQIQGDSQSGSVVGGVAGGFVGSTIGQGRGSVLASVGGALVGALVGGLTQKELSEQKALQYIVRLKDGNLVTVIQGLDNRIAVGQPVLILYGKETRLIPETAGSV
ncbi:MAG: glycine zipper 2TM domain-containing protein [Alphaproteobacteria bacterium]|jgi:outer membrane lipoprotein SlyB